MPKKEVLKLSDGVPHLSDDIHVTSTDKRRLLEILRKVKTVVPGLLGNDRRLSERSRMMYIFRQEMLEKVPQAFDNYRELLTVVPTLSTFIPRTFDTKRGKKKVVPALSDNALEVSD